MSVTQQKSNADGHVEQLSALSEEVKRRGRRLAYVSIFGVIGIATVVAILSPGFVLEIGKALIKRETSGGLLHPAIIATAVFVFLWERYWPVGGRKISGPAQLTDLGWWLLNATMAVGAPVLAATLAQKAADSVTPGPEPFDIFGWLPWALRYVLAILMVDFVRYAIHVARHKIPLLWRFHATHHSTHELNQFSAYRMHPVDYAFSIAVAAIPFTLFSVPKEGFVLYVVLTGVLGRTHHAAVNWRWPIINRIFVSPQAHRIHHSTDQAHYDKNYGLTFSLWDRIFGTYFEPTGDDPTPVTGVAGFQSPEAESFSEVPVVLAHQLIAPFRKFVAMEEDPHKTSTSSQLSNRKSTESTRPYTRDDRLQED